MLEANGSRLGKFNFLTRTLEKNERKFYGIFISHSSKDTSTYLKALCEAMKEAELYPLCDRDFLTGGDDYQNKIENALDCYAAVIIVTESSLRSHWVNYEIGFLTGLGIPIYLWDPKGVLNQKFFFKESPLAALGRAHLNPYLPAYRDMKKLVSHLASLSPYSDMFSEENAFLDKESFRERMNKHVRTIIATFESELFDIYNDYFKECKIGMIIPNFGMFYPDHGDGVSCFAAPVCTPLSGGVCPENGLPCALSMPRELGEENKECVLLNYTLYNGKFYRKGEIDRRGAKINQGCIVFNVPVHRLYGTEFKIIVDVPPHIQSSTLVKLFEQMGANPSSSSLGHGDRIYVALPERRTQGLFALKHQFSNNFLCPHAARERGSEEKTQY